MVKIEEHFQLLAYFDTIRLFAKCLWEDMPIETIKKNDKYTKVSNNTKVVDMVLLQEAKKRKIVLPSKSYTNIKADYQGAYREVFKRGRFEDISVFDMDSGYPTAMIDFALATENIREKPNENTLTIPITDRETGEHQITYYFEQNKNSIMISVIKDAIVIKNQLKEKLNKMDPDDKNYKNLKVRYDAQKSLINTFYGASGSPYFRFYDKRVAETTAFLIRDLLHYVVDNLKEMVYDILYADTDGFMKQGKENILDLINDLVYQWGCEKYENMKVSIKFDYEGYFIKLFISKLCHYIGYMDIGHGIKRVVKGLAMKRSNSSKYESHFQEQLLEKILNKETKDNINQWILQEKENIKSLPLKELGFPVKIANTKYKNRPIQLRAYEYTKDLYPEMKIKKGQLFYYIFLKPFGYETKNVVKTTRFLDGKRRAEKKLDEIIQLAYEDHKLKADVFIDIDKFKEKYIKNLKEEGRLKITTENVEKRGQPKNLIAFTDKNIDTINIKEIDWNAVIERSINKKVNGIFEAMGWEES